MSAINFGPMQVYHTDLTGVNATAQAPTQGGVSISFEFETYDTLADQTGTTARNKYYVGSSATITANYTEMELDEVLGLFPAVDGTYVTVPVGCDAREDTISLLLRPIICGEISSDDDDCIFAPIVLPQPAFQTEFSTSNQRIWTVNYQVLPFDPKTGDFRMISFGAKGITPKAT